MYSIESGLLGSQVSTVFLGDSHAMCAFNDSIIPNSFNTIRNSESYFQTYYKLKWILNANPQINNVILSYSPHNISIKQNEIILYGNRYYPLFDEQAKGMILNADEYNLLSLDDKCDLSILKEKFKHLAICNFLEFKWTWGFPVNMNEYWDYLGERQKSSKKLYLHPLFTTRYTSNQSNLNIQTIQTALNRHFYSDTNVLSSDIMIHSLIKMGELCEKNQVILLLVGTPLHKSYKNAIPSDILAIYYSLADSLTRGNNFITFSDFSDMEFQEKEYGDGDHLNYTGNKNFSKLFSTYLIDLN